MIKKLFENAKLKKIITLSLMGLSLLFTVIFSVCELQGKYLGYKIWDSFSSSFIGSSTLLMMSGIMTIIYIAVVLLCATSFIKKKDGDGVAAWFGITYFVTMLGTNSAGKNCLSGVQIFMLAVVLVASLLHLTLRYFNFRFDKTAEINKSARSALTMNVVSLFVMLSVFVVPFSTKKSPGFLFEVMFSGSSSILLVMISMVAMVLYAFVAGFFSTTLKYYHNDLTKYATKCRQSAYADCGFAFAYALFGVVYSATQGGSKMTLAYLPFILVLLVSIVQCVFLSKVEGLSGNKAAFSLKNKEQSQIILYTLLFAVIFFVSLALTLFKVQIKNPVEEIIEEVSVTGYEAINNASLNSGFAVISYVFMLLIGLNVVLTVVALIATFSSAEEYDKIAKSSIFTSFMSTFIVGAFSVYYMITEKVNLSLVKPLLEINELTLESINYKVSVSGTAVYMIIVAAVLLALLLFTKPFSKLHANCGSASAYANRLAPAGAAAGAVAGGEAKSTVSGTISLTEDDTITQNNCPAFTELDGKQDEFDADLRQRKQSTYSAPTLPQVVDFVVNYAKNSRLHLSYTREDIATFIAGLGATRLSILQGMSGTGKTSLPKIFTEALLGNCELVEVESSWKDKNELLGYYNEFSKTYTPKKFTQALYKAALNPEIITFIVLDEMNLSRIEYYFSDFLSLMENEEDKREIKLLNTQIFNTYDGEKHPFAALKGNHTIKIPTNIWFIGTANRDESTFEISDKVYDRAYTMNFDKRAAAITEFDAPIPQRYLSYASFRELLEKATSFAFTVDGCQTIAEVEKLLAPYNISFGNRIAKQIETFVKIYCSCFANPSEMLPVALETILLSKVVHKLEYKNILNKDALVRQFEKLRLYKCAEFVTKLNEEF